MRTVLTRLPVEMCHEVQAITQREASNLASVLRRLAKQRLDQWREQH
jgi:hypothetical protein